MKKSKKKSPKQDRVYIILRKNISEGLLKPGNRLPSLKKLAIEFRTSHVTILRAFSRLEEQGLITRINGKGVFIGKIKESDDMQPCIQARESKADMIADQIISDISTGNLKTGDFLPLQKVLRHQYGASQLIIQKAIKKIIDRGLIHRKGSWYHVGSMQDYSLQKLKSRYKVYFLTFSNVLRAATSKRLWYFCRVLEDEFARYDVSLHYANCNPGRSLMTMSIKGSKVLGFVYMPRPVDFSKPPYGLDVEKLKDDFQFLANSQKPVVWYYLDLDQQLPESFGRQSCKNIYPFRIDFMSKKSGEMLGAYLGSLGHRNVAFISAVNENWCEQRLAGLLRGLTNVLGDKVHVLRFSSEFGNKSLVYSVDEQAQRLKKADEISQIFYKRKLARDHMYRKITSSVNMDVLLDGYYLAMEPMFKKALLNKDITVWVCADGLMAGIAAMYLKEKGIRVPEDISIAGIEDIDYSLFQSVDVFDFNTGRAGYLAAHVILGDIPIKRNRKGVVECPGRIIERGSVRRV